MMLPIWNEECIDERKPFRWDVVRCAQLHAELELLIGGQMKNPNLVIFSATLVIAILSISCYGTARTVRALQFEPNIMPVLQMGVPYETKIRITQNVTPAGDIWIS